MTDHTPDYFKGSRTSEWATPQYLFDELHEKFRFTLDPCATDQNAKCEKYFTEKDDGLSKSWQGHIVFMNPPYGRMIGKWVKKAYWESHKPATVVVGLLPAKTGPAWFHDFIAGKAVVQFLRGRIKFVGNNGIKNSAPFDSMIVIWGLDFGVTL